MRAGLDFLLFGWWHALRRRRRLADPTVAGAQPPDKLYWSEEAHYLLNELDRYFDLSLRSGAVDRARQAGRQEITVVDVADSVTRSTTGVQSLANLYRDKQTEPDQPTEKSCANVCKSGCSRGANRQKVSGS